MDRRDKRETWERLKAANPVIPEQVGDWAASAEARALLARASAELGADTAAGSAAARALVPSRARPRHLSRLGWVAGFVALVALTLGIVVGRGWFVAEEAAPVAGLEEVSRQRVAAMALQEELLQGLAARQTIFQPVPQHERDSLGRQAMRLAISPVGPRGASVTKAELAELAWNYLSAMGQGRSSSVVYTRPSDTSPDLGEAVAGLAARGVLLLSPDSDETLDAPASDMDLYRVDTLLREVAGVVFSGQ